MTERAAGVGGGGGGGGGVTAGGGIPGGSGFAQRSPITEALCSICAWDALGPIGPVPQTMCPSESDCVPGYTSAQRMALSVADIEVIRNEITVLRDRNIKLRLNVLVPVSQIADFSERLKRPLP
jgi:hypothetical protein